MSVERWAQAGALAALLLGVACRADAGQAPPPNADRAQAATTTPANEGEAAVAVSKAWLEALKIKDRARLADGTRFPFTFTTTNKKKACDGSAADSAKLAGLVDCLAKREKMLMEELGRAEKLPLQVVAPAKVPAALDKLVGRPAGNERLVTTFINGDGITFELVLIVTPGEGKAKAGVRALLLNSEIEGG